MKRTPILDVIDKDALELAQERSVGVNPSAHRYVESGRTAYDNLSSTSVQGVAFKNKLPAFLSRSAPKSFQELLDWLRVLFGSIKPDSGGLADRKPGSVFARRRHFRAADVAVHDVMSRAPQRL